MDVKPLPYGEHFKSLVSNKMFCCWQGEKALWKSLITTNQVRNPPAGFHRPRPKVSRTSTNGLKWTLPTRVHFWRSVPNLPA